MSLGLRNLMILAAFGLVSVSAVADNSTSWQCEQASNSNTIKSNNCESTCKSNGMAFKGDVNYDINFIESRCVVTCNNSSGDCQNWTACGCVPPKDQTENDNNDGLTGDAEQDSTQEMESDDNQNSIENQGADTLD